MNPSLLTPKAPKATKRSGSKKKIRLWRVEGLHKRPSSDVLATEEPLEIRLALADELRPLALTMRTPGHDFELAAGFLFSEGVIQSRADILSISYCLAGEKETQQYNQLKVNLRQGDLSDLERFGVRSSACGICGKTSLDSLKHRGLTPLADDFKVTALSLYQLPQQLAKHQGLFSETGGLHAAALFNLQGELFQIREDIGRHNALDKLIGWALLNDHLPLKDHILLLSGRSSYELLQKSLSAGIALVCAVSAPSSLAVSLAESFGITLVGFLRGERFNIYSHPERIELV
ncbi:MAG: formate dehydrogenase accessory sulfurtransferase FdhD [Deinococcales bacterium]